MTDIAKQSHRIETPRGHLYAECWSPRKSRGVPIVLLHDSLGCVELWRDFPLRLAQSCGREVIAYDRLGFGRSSACLVNLTPSFIEDEAHGDFQAVREYFQLSQFVVFGHSVGGGMAVGCAAAHPQACHGLITESAQAAVDNAILDGIRSAARRFALPGQMERLQQYHGKKAEWFCAVGSILGSRRNFGSGTLIGNWPRYSAQRWFYMETATSMGLGIIPSVCVLG